MTGAIGAFAIGVDAIGSTRFDYTPTLLSQYANSPTILALIDSFADCIDPTTDIDNFYDYVWNVDTAQGFGLDTWGRIVGVSRVFPVADVAYFGFEEAGDALGFNQGVFWSGNALTTNFALSDDAFRRLILAKAESNICDGSIPSINQLLRNMFPGRGNAYVVDNLNMTMTYRFDFALSPVDLTIVQNSGVLPAPTGVAVFIEHH